MDIIFGIVRKDDPIKYDAPIIENRSFIGVLPGRG